MIHGRCRSRVAWIRLVGVPGIALLTVTFLGGCRAPALQPPPALGIEHFRDQMLLLGHRNWMVITDSAYPLQSSPGITTFYIGGSLIHAARDALAMIDASHHVRANVWLDQELGDALEAGSPGVAALRSGLNEILAGREVKTEPHESLLARLEQVAEHYDVIVFKTDETVPYSSVFLELDCAYAD